MKSWALNQIIALNHHNESLDLGPKSTLSLQRSESPRNPTSMAGPTSHRRRDWLELVSDRKDGDHSVELDESNLTEDEVKALPRRSLNHQNRYCQSLRLR